MRRTRGNIQEQYQKQKRWVGRDKRLNEKGFPMAEIEELCY